MCRIWNEINVINSSTTEIIAQKIGVLYVAKIYELYTELMTDMKVKFYPRIGHESLAGSKSIALLSP